MVERMRGQELCLSGSSGNVRKQQQQQQHIHFWELESRSRLSSLGIHCTDSMGSAGLADAGSLLFERRLSAENVMIRTEECSTVDSSKMML